MIEIEAMTDDEVAAEIGAVGADFTEADHNRLISLLMIKAACLHWPGHPLKQPPRAVLACIRQVIAERSAAAQS
jgi:hypothetical protein